MDNIELNYKIPLYDEERKINQQCIELINQYKHLYYILYHIILFQEINSQILLNNKYNNKVNIQINIIKQNILDVDIKNIFIYKANIKDKLGQNVDKYTRIFAKIYTKNLKTLNKNSNKYKEIEQKRQNIIYNLDYLDKIYVIWDKLAERHEKAKALNNLCVSKFYVNSLLSNKLNNKKTTKLVAKKENKKNTNNALIKEVNYGLLENTNNSIAPSKGNNKANFLTLSSTIIKGGEMISTRFLNYDITGLES